MFKNKRRKGPIVLAITIISLIIMTGCLICGNRLDYMIIGVIFALSFLTFIAGLITVDDACMEDYTANTVKKKLHDIEDKDTVTAKVGAGMNWDKKAELIRSCKREDK